MTLSLFADEDQAPAGPAPLVPGSSASVLLRAFALPYLPELLPALDAIVLAAPLRHMATPGGLRMSVAMSNCGALGWVTDGRGYRYARLDPASGLPWPPMPPVFLRLAQEAALAAGYAGFVPDACLVNRYAPGARMALHQDRDECDFTAPIVSVSLGLPATFLFGGAQRADKAARIPLLHGDVVVWGGADRLRFHGVAPLKEGEHAVLGAQRINLTFRKAG
ncbi:DNA oxidative demethylase AlkB [Janthinobacterium sp. FW305-129]|uniref:DNA oxidative demethylase AlkB n=1 Tax=Janthinobacterium sp. FW305-129 TaxID=2775054 RepID=UPI001E30264B|nr:DNA oxidative demethylase AlkB [Janthinobacterium sp. FW305-129]MCC7597997.1 DNA oxidative demethylase AlkB [Janthinobacterium sp. FW305-129]